METNLRKPANDAVVQMVVKKITDELFNKGTNILKHLAFLTKGVDTFEFNTKSIECVSRPEAKTCLHAFIGSYQVIESLINSNPHAKHVVVDSSFICGWVKRCHQDVTTICIEDVIRGKVMEMVETNDKNLADDKLSGIDSTSLLLTALKEFKKENNDEKFDTIIVIPPYNKTLHLKVLATMVNDVLEDGGQMVSLQPLQQFATLRHIFVEVKKKKDLKAVVDIDKHIKAITVLKNSDGDNPFGIRDDGNLGIWHIEKTGKYKGQIETYARNRFEALIPVWDKVCTRIIRGEVQSLKDNFVYPNDDTFKALLKKEPEKLFTEEMQRKPFVCFVGAVGGDGERYSSGNVRTAFSALLSLASATKVRDTVGTKGGFIPYTKLGSDPVAGRRKLIEHCIGGKEYWLMRATSLVAKADGRVSMPRYVWFPDLDDPRSDDEIAMQDFGFTEEEMKLCRDKMREFIVPQNIPDSI